LIATGCYDTRARIWNDAQQVLSVLEGHTRPIKAVAWGNGEADGASETRLRPKTTQRPLNALHSMACGAIAMDRGGDAGNGGPGRDRAALEGVPAVRPALPAPTGTL